MKPTEFLILSRNGDIKGRVNVCREHLGAEVAATTTNGGVALASLSPSSGLCEWGQKHIDPPEEIGSLVKKLVIAGLCILAVCFFIFLAVESSMRMVPK